MPSVFTIEYSPLPEDLVSFKPLCEKEESPAFESNPEVKELENGKKLAFPMEQIQHFWELHQFIARKDSKKPTSKQNTPQPPPWELRFQRHEFHLWSEEVPITMYAGAWHVIKPPAPEDEATFQKRKDEAASNGDTALPLAPPPPSLLCRSVWCADLNLAKRIAASQALQLLTPHYAKGIAAENTLPNVVFLNPIDTRDNIFELNGHTLVEQAMELLCAARETVKEISLDGEIARYADPSSAKWTEYAKANRSITEAYRTLVQHKQRFAAESSAIGFKWTLENVAAEPHPDLPPTKKGQLPSPDIHFGFKFDVLKVSTTSNAADVFVSCVSEYQGEPLTRVVYRGLLAAARELKVETLMRDLFQEFALSLCPSMTKSSFEYMRFYFDAFFGVHHDVKSRHGSPSVLAAVVESDGAPGADTASGDKNWEYELRLDLPKCGFFVALAPSVSSASTFIVSSAPKAEQLSIFLLKRVSQKRCSCQIQFSMMDEMGAVCFSFAQKAMMHYLADGNKGCSGTLQDKLVVDYQKLIHLFPCCAAPHLQWEVSSS